MPRFKPSARSRAVIEQVVTVLPCRRASCWLKLCDGPPTGVNVNVRSKTAGWNTRLLSITSAGVHSAGVVVLGGSTLAVGTVDDHRNRQAVVATSPRPERVRNRSCRSRSESGNECVDGADKRSASENGEVEWWPGLCARSRSRLHGCRPRRLR